MYDVAKPAFEECSMQKSREVRVNDLYKYQPWQQISYLPHVQRVSSLGKRCGGEKYVSNIDEHRKHQAAKNERLEDLVAGVAFEGY